MLRGPDGVGPRHGEVGSSRRGEPGRANAPEPAEEGLSSGRASPGMSSMRTEKRLSTRSHRVLAAQWRVVRITGLLQRQGMERHQGFDFRHGCIQGLK